jgi:hypothetical protein
VRQKGFAHVVLILIVALALAGGYFSYSRGYFQGNWQPEQNSLSNVSITQAHQQAMDITSQPTIADQLDTSTKPSRTILYRKIADWNTYISLTGYSMQYPAYFRDEPLGEQFDDNNCFNYFTNNVGETISSEVRSYDGGSRRKLLGLPEGYQYTFEDVIIQEKSSLLVEIGPVGDSGSGSKAVIPVGNYVLILSWTKIQKNSFEFLSLLQSVKIDNSLDLSKCAK